MCISKKNGLTTLYVDGCQAAEINLPFKRRDTQSGAVNAPRTVLGTAGPRAHTVCLEHTNSTVRYWNTSSLSARDTTSAVYLMTVIEIEKREAEIWCLIDLFLRARQLRFQCHSREKIQGRDKSAFLVWVPAANIEENESHASTTALRLMPSLPWRRSIRQGKQITSPLFTWGHICPQRWSCCCWNGLHSCYALTILSHPPWSHDAKTMSEKQLRNICWIIPWQNAVAAQLSIQLAQPRGLHAFGWSQNTLLNISLSLGH